MQIQEKHRYHGSALAQIVEHDSYKAINVASERYGHYRVNDNREIFIKYVSAGQSPWKFNLQTEELKGIREVMEGGNPVYLCLVCGARTVCVLTGEDIGKVVNLRSKKPQYIAVKVPPRSSCHVQGSAGELDHAVPHNAFPAAIFAYRGVDAAPPTGKPAVNDTITGPDGRIRAGATKGRRAGSGDGLVDLGVVVTGGSRKKQVIFPAGTSFVPDDGAYQNGLLVQDTVLEAPANTRVEYVLSAYCANRHREQPERDASYRIGPVLWSPALEELITLLRGVEIPESAVEQIQDAVWEVTDGNGLSAKSRRLIQALARKTAK